MKGLLFLSLVGAGIYTALVVTHDFLPSDRAADTLTSQGLCPALSRCVRGALTSLR